MLRLLSLLQSHRFWPGADLATKLQVSDRTLRRDIDRLRGLGYQLQSGSGMPPLLLDDDEAVAIAVGLCTTANAAISGVEETSVRALAKVVQVMPPRLRRRVDALQSYIVPPDWGGGTPVDARVLTVIAQAARDSERLRFGYRTREGETSIRQVEPHWLVPYARRWYLVAYDVGRGDWRTFRLDRLTDPEPTGGQFRARDLPGDHDAPSFVRSSIGSAPRSHQVEVRIAAPADVVGATVRSWGTVEAAGDGWTRLTMNVDSFHWPAVVLAEIGAPFTVVEPEELRAYLNQVSAFFGSAAELAERREET
jgi:predicted DNA-binding transcriptional regulator YafY